ncbi:ATP-dependent RNA helicase DDX42-like [Ptychodera flava]|uniref:ATP-dependent RNA helicase DDX42-like n=1 Tax=Ptychodera flava TaxID=63121 RepID=UPI00396A76CF
MYHKGSPDKPRGFGFGGFSLSRDRRREEPLVPQAPQYPISSGGGAPFILKNAMSTNRTPNRKRYKSEQDYFDDSDEETPGVSSKSRGFSEEDDEDDDPLDAFMAGLENDLQKQKQTKEKEDKNEKKKKGLRQDIEEADDHETYFKYMEDNPNAGLLVTDDDEVDIEYDEDGNPIIPEKNRIIDPLPPIDHSQIEYSEFTKDFYDEHEDISKLGLFNLIELRRKLGIKVSGYEPPKPVSSFAHFGFDEQLMHYIRKSDYSTPMPIQAQGVPVIMSGRDIIGIAKTGSGKTAAFIWPLLIHIMDQPEIQAGDGPIGLICAPTRELSQQIYQECKRFGKAYNIHTVCAYGGGNMWEQTKACQEGCEILVATPGRLIDLVKKKATNLRRVTYLVFDEADRMFDMGFEPQVRSIANHVRPDRQTMLFSATFRKKVEKLARDILTDPVRVVQGDVGEANEDVTQIVELLPDGPSKWTWLIQRLVSFTTTGSVLIFVTKKANCEELAMNLKNQDFDLGLLHGDLDQSERNKVINNFKRGMMPVLVATDVAARGLDIPSIRTVVNYDVARDIDTHTHRIGRTGRAGTKGIAYTLINVTKDVNFAGDLVRNLEGVGQTVPDKLMDLAMQNSWFRKSRQRKGKKGRINRTKGLGYRERPGLGTPTEQEEVEQSIAFGDTYAQESEYTQPSRNTYSSSSSSSSSSSQQVISPGIDRLQTVKSAFMAQYKSHFKAASSNSTSSTMSTGDQPRISSKPPSSHRSQGFRGSGSGSQSSRWSSSGSSSNSGGISIGNFTPSRGSDSNSDSPSKRFSEEFVAPKPPKVKKSRWDK